MGRDRIEELHPAVGEAWVRAEVAAEESAGGELLDLCVGRARAIAAGSSPDSLGELSARERSYVEFTEQFATDVANVSDAQVRALRAYDSDENIYAFIAALYVLDMSRRVEIVASEVLG